MVLLLQANGDILNRIETIVSGMCWAEELGISLEVYWWFMVPSLHVPFTTFFRVDTLPSWVFIRSGYIENPTGIRSEEEFLEKGKPLVLKSKSRFYNHDSEKWLYYLRLIQPSAFLVPKITMTPCAGCLGIYIHGFADSPLSKVLSELWMNHRDQKYFLVSTDCRETKRFFELMFRDRVYFTNPSTFAQSEKYSVDKVVDFFCLSRCTSVMDLTGSLLPRLAAEYRGIPYVPV